jgi:hypothetical protein
MAGNSEETSLNESREILGPQPFVVGDIVWVKPENKGKMIEILSKEFGRLKFVKSQHVVLGIEPNNQKKCWAVKLSGLREDDLLNANDFELVPAGQVYKKK